MAAALLPLLLSSAYFGHPSSGFLEPDFNVALQPDPLYLSRFGYYVPTARDRDFLDTYYRPWAALLRPENGGGFSSINLDKDGLKIVLDLNQFKPEEIEVKVVDKYIIVKAQHEEKKEEQGLIARQQFLRKYFVPENVDADKISSSLSSDGVLTIQAPVKELPEEKKERKIEIEITGQPALKGSQGGKKEKEETTPAPSSAPDAAGETSSAAPEAEAAP